MALGDDELIERVKLILDERSARKLERDMDMAMRRSAMAMRAPRDELGKFTAEGVRSARTLETGFKGTFGRIGAAVTSTKALIATLGVGLIGKALLDANRLAQSLQAQLKVTEGSDAAAQGRFSALEKFATETPFQLNEVTQAFLDLR